MKSIPANDTSINDNHYSSAFPHRVASVDVYRGFVMFLMMAEVLSFHKVSELLPLNSFWKFVSFHQEHVPWTGCSLHDLIQPSFSFLVGVALPYSIASRKAKGVRFRSMLFSAVKRSLILILLGIFLRSLWSNQTNFTFEDTLTQIGLGYTFLFLFGFISERVQIIGLVLILFGYWLAFALYPISEQSIDQAIVKVPVDWKHHMHGFMQHWNKNANLGSHFDCWFLNLFPREKPFLYNNGGYVTLSFIPTVGTMILGLLAGNVLRDNSTAALEKARKFIIAGFVLIVFALFVHTVGINPIVKRIWTPAWVLFSGGCCFLMLAFFYWLIDIRKRTKWMFVLKVIGMNSIAAYVIAFGFGIFLTKMLYIHLGKQYDQILGDTYSTLIKGSLILMTEWLILYWMHKKKIFIKV